MMTTAALAGAASILAGVSALQVPALLGSPELRVGAARAVRGLVDAAITSLASEESSAEDACEVEHVISAETYERLTDFVKKYNKQ